jgi:aldose 1-epimerase
LELTSDGPGPYRYQATSEYTIDRSSLTMRLTVVSRTDLPLPFGLGFHPWLPRTAATLLKAPAATVWLESADHLPVCSAPVTLREDWDFSLPQTLPPAWVNNAFTGWTGQATIEWRDRALTLDVEGSDRLRTYLLYSPSKDADFFCFEPVTHVVDAHNLPDGPESGGLAILSEGESASVSCRFRIRL